MSENDIIAEYVKEYHPEILTTLHFATYRLGSACRKFANDFIESISKIDFSKVAQSLTLAEENNLASYSDFDFVLKLRPFAMELSELTGKQYCFYLNHAKDLLLAGNEKEEVLEYFRAKVQCTKEGRS